MSNITLSWGTRIIILYLGFVALIATLVVGSMRQDFDLVSKDYYSEELKYQNIINASKNQSKLSEAISLKQTSQNIQITFPEEFRNSTLKGTIHFYSQVNARWDRIYNIETNAEGCYNIPTKELQETSYLVKLKWNTGNREYYQETPIKIYK